MDPAEELFIKKMLSIMDEHTRRLFLGGYSSLPWNKSIAELSRCTGVSRTTITTGVKEYSDIDIEVPASEYLLKNPPKHRVRKSGGGRKRLTDKYPELAETMYSLMDGYNDSPIIWTTKDRKTIQRELSEKGITIPVQKRNDLWNTMGIDTTRYYPRNNYTYSAEDLKEANDQYNFIKVVAKAFISYGMPVFYLDIDTRDYDYNHISDIAVSAITQWLYKDGGPKISADVIMIVFYFHGYYSYISNSCESMAEKMSETFERNVLVSALPGIGMSKWIDSRRVFKLDSIQLYKIRNGIQNVPYDHLELLEVKSRISHLLSHIEVKTKDSHMNSYCDYRHNMID